MAITVAVGSIFSRILTLVLALRKGVVYWEIAHMQLFYQALSIASLSLTAGACFGILYKIKGKTDDRVRQRSYFRFTCWIIVVSTLDLSLSTGLKRLTGQSYQGQECVGLFLTEIVVLFLLYGAWGV